MNIIEAQGKVFFEVRLKSSIGTRHYRKAYLTARLSVLGLSRKPKFNALVML